MAPRVAARPRRSSSATRTASPDAPARRPCPALTAYTAQGQHPVELPDTSPYEAMIDHVLACLSGRHDNLIEPASALAALELTLDVQDRLTHPADQPGG